MLRKTMIILATAAALTGGLTADAFASHRGLFAGQCAIDVSLGASAVASNDPVGSQLA
jgi:hypothetical protein